MNRKSTFGSFRILAAFWLVCAAVTLSAQTRTIEGKLLNLAGEPIAGATATLHTPQNEQTTTGENGFFRFQTTEFPTSVVPIYGHTTQLKPGEVSCRVIDLTGRTVLLSNGYLHPNGKVNLHENTSALHPLNPYIIKLSDSNHNTLTGKFIYQHLPFTLQAEVEKVLKSATGDDYFDYKITFSPNTEQDNFADTLLKVENFLKTETYHSQDRGM